ncbi:MAG: bifunctional 5,10-methylenetetrahydrofolate dehydrogenase/5,10-methenyltetrahydrofolate cyclohydrolase [Candidatus Taylorbacteria bacterium]|nr:bifunctional 5,10-methylenetetrahydrofolate dehydrogenase/5,10-methenyltetrahydrofolate cyclohydrolase [Candidatus Taylorbacteria bacterium]
MIIDGRKISEEVLEELKRQISSKNLKLRLAAVLVGNDQEFEKFVQLKGKAAKKIGVEFKIRQFPKEIETEELAKRIREISAIADGILVEMPLPEHIDSSEVLNEIPVEKDVDVLSEKAQRRFYGQDLEVELPSGLGSSTSRQVFPPAVEALKIVLEKYSVVVKGKKVAVFGQGALIGKPISHWLERQGAEVFRIRSKTENPEKFSREVNIVIAGVGKPGLIMGDMVREGVIVIDFGYGKKDNKMVGDVDFDSVSPKASLITPVPGGMGPILIVAVLKNLVKLNAGYDIS